MTVLVYASPMHLNIRRQGKDLWRYVHSSACVVLDSTRKRGNSRLREAANARCEGAAAPLARSPGSKESAQMFTSTTSAN